MLQFLFFLIRDVLLLLGYVSGGGSFPKPLSKAEEAEALAAMAKGDDTARAKLIEHNLRLVVHVVRKYTVPGYTTDDLVSVGTLGLIKAVNTYRADAPTPLSTYAARCIENAIPSPTRHGQGKGIFLPISGAFAPGFRRKCISCAAQREVR
ncbi:MAG: sigma-70 family RNA polymerase sigma factor [Clostridia bacterium]|nr:sigma-70 family RNA polymerase sigma factor [Clostridia bacterium]